MSAKRVTLRDVAAASGVSRATAGFVLSDCPGGLHLRTHPRAGQAGRARSRLRAARHRAGAARRLVADRHPRGRLGQRRQLRAHLHPRPRRRARRARSRAPGQARPRRAGLHAAGARRGRAARGAAAGGELPRPWATSSTTAGGTAGSPGNSPGPAPLPGDARPLPHRRGAARRRPAARRRCGCASPPRRRSCLDIPARRRRCSCRATAQAAARAVAGVPRGARRRDRGRGVRRRGRPARARGRRWALGRAVPGDLAVIGFDDTEYGALSTPALTTIHIDAEDHGRRTARIILGLDADGFTAAPAEVIVRESA